MSKRCPTLQDLLEGGPEATAHARNCARCQGLLALSEAPPAEEAVATKTPEFETARLPERQRLAERAVGEVVALASRERADALLLATVLARTADDLQIVPISTEVGQATEWDLILEPADAPLGYATIAEVWNHGRVHISQVVESHGALSTSAAEMLLALYTSLYAETPPAEAHTGSRVLSENDPRLLFQDAEAQRAHSFWSEAEEGSRVASAESSLGARLLLWLEESGNDPSDLSRDAGWLESDVDLALRDSIDPMRASFDVDRIVDLLEQTDIEGEEAEQLLVSSVPANMFAVSSPSTGEHAWRRAPGVERRLRPRRVMTEEPSPEQVAALESWARTVVELLEERRS
jgi:hypothetical protein